jgi:hypothetical protein
MYSRADVCQLLLRYGLKPTPALVSGAGESPLVAAIEYGFNRGFCLSLDERINTIRLLWENCDQVDDFTNIDSPHRLQRYKVLDGTSLDMIEWLWYHAEALLNRGELLAFRSWLLKWCVEQYERRWMDDQLGTWGDDLIEPAAITDRIIKLMDDEMIRYYSEGGVKLLASLFDPFPMSSSDSAEIGSLFIDLLSRLGLDVETCILKEMEGLRSGCFLDEDRKVIFELIDGGGWVLRWIWIIDPCEPGSLLLSEHTGLGPDCRSVSEWPYSGRPYPDPLESQRENAVPKGRFERRMISKERKERARTGQKRAKSKMPGAWS